MYLPPATVSVKFSDVYVPPPLAPSYLPSKTSAVGHLLTPCSASFAWRHETQLTNATLLGLTPSARAALEVKPQSTDPMDKYFGSKS